MNKSDEYEGILDWTRKGRSILVIAFAALALGILPSQTKTGLHRKAGSSTISKPATLGAGFQAVTDMTAAQFSSAGLQKLTDDELVALSAFISQHTSNAVEVAKTSETRYKCGPFTANYEKVKIYIEPSEHTPAQIMSDLHSRLRSIPDVQIVFSATDSDFGITILGIENRNASYVFGYSAAVSTFDGCEATYGDRKWQVQIVRNQWMFTGPSISSVLDPMIANIDTREIESTRSFNAAMKKYQVQPK